MRCGVTWSGGLSCGGVLRMQDCSSPPWSRPFTAVHDTRIDGDSYFTQFNDGTGAATTLNFKFLGVRTIANSTD